VGVRNSDPTAAERARSLRNGMSLPEKMLWSRIRAGRLGYMIRRQYPIGPYIADFYIHELRICIEVDGKDHEFREEKDARRDQYFEEQGIETIRISARSIFSHLDDVFESLYHGLRERQTGLIKP
jgi:very-short-patch-repair endonuclease